MAGVIHEYIFGMAIGRMQGHQTAFFMIQGCAVAATFKIEPGDRRRPLWIASGGNPRAVLD